MPKSVNRALRVSTGCLVLLGCLALTTVGSFGLEIVFLGFLVLAVSPFLEFVDRRTPVFRRMTSFLTLVFALVILPQMVIRLGVLVALTILCLYIQAYLLVHNRSVRDYQYIFLMAFFLVVSACAQNPEPSLGLVVPFFMLAIVWCFGMLQIRKDVTSDAGVAIGELLTAPTKDRLVPLGGFSHAEQPRVIGATLSTFLVLTAASCFLLSLAIFALTPRMEVGMLGASDFNFSTPRASDSVNLSYGGRIGSSSSPVMRVRFPREPGGQYNGDLYWRVTSLNHYAYSEWDRRRISEDDFADRMSRTRNRDSGEEEQKRTERRYVYQEIYLDDPPPFGVPCLPFPREAEPTTAGSVQLDWDRSGDMTVVARRQRSIAISYDVLSAVPEPDPEALRQYPEHFASLRGQRGFPFFYARVMGTTAYEIYTQEELSDATRQLVQEITAPYDNPYDQALAIMRWFDESNFTYTLNVPSATGVDPVEQFIHETRMGHCELYASAMALMLRSIGIPARVVSGYRGGEWSDADKAYIVRGSMAHMWVEVYFINYGWVRFDPTPESDLPELEISAVSRYVSRKILNLKMMWFRDVVGYSGGIRLADLRRFSFGLVWFDFDAMKSAVLDRPILSGAIPKVVFWGVLALAVPVGLFSLVRRRPRRVSHHVTFTPDQIRATRLFGKMKRRLQKLGIDCSGKSAGEVFVLLKGEAKLHEESAAVVIEAYRSARFGGRSLDRRRYAELNRAIHAMGASRRHPSKAEQQ